MSADVKVLHLIFDLDDTLLDTYRQLIPRASRESCAAMIHAGLMTTIDACVKERESYVHSGQPPRVYTHLVEHFGVRDGADAKAIAQIGYDAFHNREVKEDIELFAPARDILRDLRSHYGLHLVTAGHRRTQESKVRLLELEALFDTIHFVDPSKGEHKRKAFREILDSSAAQPAAHLSIGNRLDTDIAEAKELGMQTCWMRYGEYAHLEPTNSLEKPDFTIKSLEELISVCRL